MQSFVFLVFEHWRELGRHVSIFRILVSAHLLHKQQPALFSILYPRLFTGCKKLRK